MSRPTYGGQAVIEGVMMRGPRDLAISVRDPDGRIVVHTEELSGVYAGRWSKMPVVRGAVLLWNTLSLGLRSLMFSANIAASTEQERAGAENGSGPEMMPAGMLWGSLIFALAAAVGLFFVLPVLIVGLLDQHLGSVFISNLVEKLVRLALIIGYMGCIGLIPDIRRVYAYHGAEHKTINAYEAGATLDVESVRRFSTAHPRCGTTFLMVVVLVSFVAFMLLGQPSIPVRILSRIVLIPLVAGLAYELIRLGAANYSRPLMRAVIAPGMAVQALSTREPDDSQLAVAIRALQEVLAADEARRSADAGIGELEEAPPPARRPLSALG